MSAVAAVAALAVVPKYQPGSSGSSGEACCSFPGGARGVVGEALCLLGEPGRPLASGRDVWGFFLGWSGCNVVLWCLCGCLMRVGGWDSPWGRCISLHCSHWGHAGALLVCCVQAALLAARRFLSLLGFRSGR